MPPLSYTLKHIPDFKMFKTNVYFMHLTYNQETRWFYNSDSSN